ncbi:hypothetical protein [Lentzea sp. NPDC051838]|uniref:hypothetical protein n=1 Tax=Lentzea sp. NPDC051838 TaxID=3154849 RepID=UPI00341223EB
MGGPRSHPTLVRAGTAALFAFGLRHLAFHAQHLDHLSAASATWLMIATAGLTVVLPATGFLMAGSTRQQLRPAGGPS